MDDPELRDPRDVGKDPWRDLGDEPAPAWRDAPPDLLAPIDDSAPVSGHTPAPEPTSSPADSPEHDWAAASSIIFPALRPAGTHGLEMAYIDPDRLAEEGARSHAQPLVDEGPAGLVVVYAMRAGGFDVIVNGDHLLTWGIPTAAIQDAAMRNLEAWSSSAAWTAEESGGRRLLSSDTGEGWDASRILLPAVIEHLVGELGAGGRILVGLPDRDLLVAGTLAEGDAEFAALFGEFIVEHSGGADEPIDRRVFEIVDGRLVEFGGAVQTA